MEHSRLVFFWEPVGFFYIKMGQAAVLPPVYTPTPKRDAPKMLLLPPASRSTYLVEKYLSGRGIDHELIRFCLDIGRLYESSGRYHNVVFVGHDRYLETKIKVLTAGRKVLYWKRRTVSVKSDDERLSAVKEQITAVSRELSVLTWILHLNTKEAIIQIES